mgnify:CR=1 FL=1
MKVIINHSRFHSRFLFLAFISLILLVGSVQCQEGAKTAEATVDATGEVHTDSAPEHDNSQNEEASKPAEAKKGPVEEEEEPIFLQADPDNWGSYYDPKQEFCGKFDCYRILGFDYESFGREHPSTKEITKRYRRLSRKWHPDKSKHPKAKERFVVRNLSDRL